jgi:hypothetical protein
MLNMKLKGRTAAPVPSARRNVVAKAAAVESTLKMTESERVRSCP